MELFISTIHLNQLDCCFLGTIDIILFCLNLSTARRNVFSIYRLFIYHILELRIETDFKPVLLETINCNGVYKSVLKMVPITCFNIDCKSLYLN